MVEWGKQMLALKGGTKLINDQHALTRIDKKPLQSAKPTTPNVQKQQTYTNFLKRNKPNYTEPLKLTTPQNPITTQPVISPHAIGATTNVLNEGQPTNTPDNQLSQMQTLYRYLQNLLNGGVR